MFSNMDNNFANVCRTCMQTCDIKFNRDCVISDIFYKLTDLRFETNEDLPQHVCLKCFDKINEIRDFAFQCKRTHFQLTKCLSNSRKIPVNGPPFTEKNTNTSRRSELVILIKDDVKIEDSKVKFEIDEIEVVSNDGLEEVESSEIKVEDNNSDESLIPIENAKQQIHSNQNELNNEQTCEICDKKFKDKRALICHKLVHSGERLLNSTYSQEFPTNNVTNSLNDVNECRKIVRSPVHRYKCTTCPKTFTRLFNLETHQSLHNNTENCVVPRYVCHVCNKAFRALHSVNLHLRMHGCERYNDQHSGERARKKPSKTVRKYSKKKRERDSFKRVCLK